MAKEIQSLTKGGALTFLKTAFANLVIKRINALSNITVYPTDAGRADVNENGVAITFYNTAATSASTEAHNLATDQHAIIGQSDVGILVEDPTALEPGISAQRMVCKNDGGLHVHQESARYFTVRMKSNGAGKWLTTEDADGAITFTQVDTLTQEVCIDGAPVTRDFLVVHI